MNYSPYQKMNLSESWICLDVVVVDVICPAVELIASVDDDPNWQLLAAYCGPH